MDRSAWASRAPRWRPAQRVSLLMAVVAVAVACGGRASETGAPPTAQTAADVAVGAGSTAPPPEPAPSPVRVMTWNLQRGQALSGPVEPADMTRFAAQVAANRADVVGLQEVTADQAAAIADILGWGPPAYVETKNPCPGAQPPRPGICVPFGNAILSRHPLGPPADWTLPASPEEAPVEQRVLLRAVVEAGDLRVPVYVTHLASNATPVEREAQVRALLEAIDADRGVGGETFRPVLLGDLNAEPTTTAIDLVRDRFVDAWADVHPDRPGYTSNATVTPTRRIDYVFVGRDGGLRPIEASVDPEAISDHLSVVAEVAPT